MTAMVRRIAGSRGLSAVVAQGWQAIGSLGLQIIAAWAMGAAILGQLSLSLGIIILTTALTSGVVGDSLVVLDRHERVVRSGLVGWTLTLNILGVFGVSAVVHMAGLLSAGETVAFALALGSFQLEELVRRIFMATLRFWRLVVIDSSAVVTTLALVGAWSLIRPVELITFFSAMVLGQGVGILVGLLMLPSHERALTRPTAEGFRQVAAFGLFRGAQVSIPPGILTAMRLLVVAAVGKAALGELEAARIYAAPMLLAVQGFGSYLLASYSTSKADGVQALVARARKASLGMIGGTLLIGALLTALAPTLGHLITGPSFSIDRIAVAGWVLYVAGTASLQPFSSLAAVLGRQAKVLWCRITDALIGISLVWLLLYPIGAASSWIPFALASGLFFGGFLVRRVALANTDPQICPPPNTVASRESRKIHVQTA